MIKKLTSPNIEHYRVNINCQFNFQCWKSACVASLLGIEDRCRECPAMRDGLRGDANGLL